MNMFRSGNAPLCRSWSSVNQETLRAPSWSMPLESPLIVVVGIGAGAFVVIVKSTTRWSNTAIGYTPVHGRAWTKNCRSRRTKVGPREN